MAPRSFKGQMFYFFYIIFSIAVFYFIVLGLIRLEFNVVSIILFVLFLSVVSFLGVRVKGMVRDYKISKEDDQFLVQLFDFLSLPILKVGKWFTLNFSKVNIFIIIVDIMIEAPFKIILKIVDEWVTFLKEIKEEVFE